MSTSSEMEYNSSRPDLIISEYGRNVQKLIKQAQAIEDTKEQQVFVEAIINLMMQMSSQSKNLDDFKDRLWRHVYRIADYNLKAMPPNGHIPTPADNDKRPDQLDYPEYEARFRHYGHNVQKLIKKAKEMEEGTIKEGFVEVIGNYMKLAYKTWNREHYISDKIIIQDLATLSDGELEVDEDASLDTLANANQRKRSNSSSSRSSNSNNRGGSRGRSSGRKRGRRK